MLSISDTIRKKKKKSANKPLYPEKSLNSQPAMCVTVILFIRLYN